MDYKSTLDYLFNQLPMYSRIGAAAYKADLSNTIQMCEILHHPEKKIKCIHVAGTNGKGSVSHMLAAVFQKNGYKTGLYTSPHLKDFRERIKINGNMVSEKYVVDFVEKFDGIFKPIAPSFFEWTVALCFQYFVDEQVDIAIIETGLGGRLDSTNVISPVLSVITNISWDHADLLGDTLQKIATEKAGIIKPDTPVVVGEWNEQTHLVFEKIAQEKNADLVFANKIFEATLTERQNEFQKIKVTGKNFSPLEITLDLTGHYQLKNICTVLQSIQVLKQYGFIFNDQKILEALFQTKKITGLQGRWQILNTLPFTVADVAHNSGGLSETLHQLSGISAKQFHFVIGFVSDKKLDEVLNLFPKTGVYYFCCPNIPRGKNASELKLFAEKFGLYGNAYSSVNDAFIDAKKNASDSDCIYVGGSTFVVAEVI